VVDALCGFVADVTATTRASASAVVNSSSTCRRRPVHGAQKHILYLESYFYICFLKENGHKA